MGDRAEPRQRRTSGKTGHRDRLLPGLGRRSKPPGRGQGGFQRIHWRRPASLRPANCFGGHGDRVTSPSNRKISVGADSSIGLTRYDEPRAGCRWLATGPGSGQIDNSRARSSSPTWLSRPSFEVASIVARWIPSLSHPSFPQGALRGVQSNDWPCGQDAQPEPVSHRRRILRHEARGQGYWVLTAGLVPCSREA
jgi:hypothetical protein